MRSIFFFFYYLFFLDAETRHLNLDLPYLDLPYVIINTKTRPLHVILYTENFKSCSFENYCFAMKRFLDLNVGN